MLQEFILEFQDKVNWYRISRYQALSDDFVRNNYDKVNWKVSYLGGIFLGQSSTENLIQEFKFLVDCDIISYQKNSGRSLRANSIDKLFGINNIFKVFTKKLIIKLNNKVSERGYITTDIVVGSTV